MSAAKAKKTSGSRKAAAPRAATAPKPKADKRAAAKTSKEDPSANVTTVFDTQAQAADAARREAEAAGVSPAAVMRSSVEGPATGEGDHVPLKIAGAGRKQTA